MGKKLGLSVKEAANLLGVHPNTIYRLAWRKEIRSVKVGSRLLIPRVEVERLVGVKLEDTDPHPGGRE
ncbi:helix-turn-helix domain-containing protein [Thermus caliditerrae]|uniref:helix-turn-helix domain-containing protein n=1 Tax=Thermus caliditerrae TaxID=1330700 RepID=UPI001F37B376|nr:helix-turn-helix domain-containing protein [Thermus caliditerrae]